MIHQLQGVKLDGFIEQIEQIIPANTKRDIWEHNHLLINGAVSPCMGESGVMPTINAVAQKTGLSRQSVARHLKEYKKHPDFTSQMEQFELMAPNVLATVFKSAVSGDVRAARLYFEMIGAGNKNQANKVVNEQNNYIQINNTILSQENLEQLTADQLNQLENIITKNAG